MQACTRARCELHCGTEWSSPSRLTTVTSVFRAVVPSISVRLPCRFVLVSGLFVPRVLPPA